MNGAALRRPEAGLPPHPNELDRRRIERALRSRQRYRYVRPAVTGVAGGYCIESPCCSRNVDADGGMVDIALLHFDVSGAIWQLFRKDHARKVWELHSVHHRLAAITEILNEDPDRVFWQ